MDKQIDSFKKITWQPNKAELHDYLQHSTGQKTLIIFKAHVIYKNYTRTYSLPVDGKNVWEKRMVRMIGLAN